MAGQVATVEEFEALRKQFSAGDCKSLYLFHGDEPFFIDRLVAILQQSVIPQEARDFNQRLVYGNEIQGNSLEVLCQQAPMLHSRRLVVAREMQTVRDLSSIVRYAEHPTATTVLALCFQGQLKPGRGLASDTAKLLAHVKRNGQVFHSQPLRDYQVEPWLSAYLKSIKLSMGPSAVQLLVSNVGTNLTRMGHEIDKLRIAQAAAGGGEITVGMVESVVGLQRDYSLFDFTTALGVMNRVQALRIANSLASSGDSSKGFLAVLSVVLAYFQKIFLYHALRACMDDAALAERLGVNPFFLKEYAQVARLYSMARCAYIFGKLRQMDLQAKGLGAASMGYEAQLRLLIATVIG